MIYISLPFVVREVSTFKLCRGQLGCLLKPRFPLSRILTQSRAQFNKPQVTSLDRRLLGELVPRGPSPSGFSTWARCVAPCRNQFNGLDKQLPKGIAEKCPICQHCAVQCILGTGLSGIFLRFDVSSCQFLLHTAPFPLPQTLRSKAADHGGPADADEPPVQHADPLRLAACPGAGGAGLRAGKAGPVRGTWARFHVAGAACKQKRAELCFAVCQTAEPRPRSLDGCVSLHLVLGFEERETRVGVSACWLDFPTDSSIFWETDLLWKPKILEAGLCHVKPQGS